MKNNTTNNTTNTPSETLSLLMERCRHNTGRHFLDSGGGTGRHWQQPPIAPDCPPCVMSSDTWQACDGETYREISATLETAHFLAEWGEVDSDLQKGFESFGGDPIGSWFEDSQEFMEKSGFVQVCRDNVYNSENELSQVYVWEVYLPASECDSKGNYNGDTIYADDAVTVFYIHTGADVRGGYGPPVFLRTQGDYNYPVDVVSSFYAVEGRREGADLAWEDLANISEEWQAGYHSLPSSQVSKEVARIFGFTQTPTSVCVLLNSGELVKVECCVPIS